MGTEFYLVNHKTKEIVELGRGNWFIHSNEKEIFLYKDYIDEHIRRNY